MMVLVGQVLAHDSMWMADEERLPAVSPLRCPASHLQLGGPWVEVRLLGTSHEQGRIREVLPTLPSQRVGERHPSEIAQHRAWRRASKP